MALQRAMWTYMIGEAHWPAARAHTRQRESNKGTGERATLHRQIEDLPEDRVGEAIDGRIYAQPRPARPQAVAASVIEMDIGCVHHRGHGGPGGWWIILEPEVHLARDVEVLVPECRRLA